MSPVKTERSAQETGEALIPLLKEYTRKLNRLAARAQEVREQSLSLGKNDSDIKRLLLRARFDLLTKSLRSIQHAAKRLVQTASQYVEHAALEDITRLELRLRLAEFEFALQAPGILLSEGRP